MPALLLDGSSAPRGCRTIPERSRRLAGADPYYRYRRFHRAIVAKSRMTLSAVLLAGGESTRMRRDKATLEWRGRPLWACQFEKLRALTSNIFVSTRFAVPWRPADVKLVIANGKNIGSCPTTVTVSSAISLTISMNERCWLYFVNSPCSPQIC